MATLIPNRLRAVLPRRWRDVPPRVAVIRLDGAIGAVSPFRAGLSIAGVAGGLEKAFSTKGIAAVALVINSPGGSAAQSHMIHRRIRALADEKGLRVFAFVEDVAASGGYMIACAADEIFADPTSLIGSIGVVSAGFGFDRLINRLGIERRVHTQGEAKAMLDPFRPENPVDVARLLAIQADVQEVFTGLVRTRRPHLREGENLFTGAVWTGRQALDLRLIDGLGDVRSTLRERFGDKVVLSLVADRQGSFLARLLRRAGPGSSGANLARDTLAALDERAAWARFGL